MNDMITQLRERIEFLEEENRQLRADMVPTDPLFLGVLSPQQMALLKGVYAHKVASYHYLDRLAETVPPNGRYAGHEPEKLRSKVAMYKLRKKLIKYGIKIGTWRGIGYYLDDENKAKLKELMEKKDD